MTIKPILPLIQGTIIALWLSLLANTAFSNSLTNIHWDCDKDVFRFHLSTAYPLNYEIKNYNPKERFFTIDIKNITQAYENRTIKPGDVRIKSIVVQSRPWEKRIRFMFYPAPGIHWKIHPGSNRNHLLVELRTTDNGKDSSKTYSGSLSPEQSSALLNGKTSSLKAIGADEYSKKYASRSSSFSYNRSQRENREHKLVIIDPGHGGFNKGAKTSCKIKGKHYWEKDLVLAYAKKLKYLIDKSPNLKAVLTRDKDEYVSLQKRVEFAQKRQGDLFISIHLNAAPNPRSTTARGIEIFHWRETGSDNAAVRYLEKLENDQDLPNLPKTQDDQLKHILKGMLKDALEEEKIRSTRLCEAMWGVFKHNPYFKKYHRNPPIKSARFVVLANYAMPSVLMEIGFLSNRSEAPLLISESFQWTSARLMYNGIQAFFDREDSAFHAHYVNY